MGWIVAGLGAFLLGFRTLTRALERLGGHAVHRALGRVGRDPVAAWLTGALAAGVLHSSGLVTVAVVSLVEAGALGFPAAIGAVLGANVGTTVTAQLMSLSTAALGWWALGLGAAMLAWSRCRRSPSRGLVRAAAAGEILAGTGLVFLGLEAFEMAFRGVPPEVHARLASLAGRPLGGVLAGAALTGVVQSSTLFVGLVMNLSQHGLVDLTGAIYLVLGGNIGSCVPGVLAGAGAGRAGRVAGLVNVVFNVVGVAAALPLVRVVAPLIAVSSTSFARQVANAHALFNLVTAGAALPLAGPLGRWLEARAAKRHI